MRIRQATISRPFLLACLFIAAGCAAFAFDGNQDPASGSQAATGTTPAVTSVAQGQAVTLEGLIVKRDTDGFTLKDAKGSFYHVTMSSSTLVKERKSNPFRGAKTYNGSQLVRGLEVEVRGQGSASGGVQASKIGVRSDDLRMADTLWAGINPVEQELHQTESRLTEAEQNEKRLSGQLSELQNTSETLRDKTKTAQDTADAASKSAADAAKTADSAMTGVEAANNRITSLDDYETKDEVTVNFNAGSAVLSKEAKSRLDKLADLTKEEKGFVIEVAGFASADGSAAFNQTLSQRRADAVIHYLAENYDIPMHRFITPIGFGAKKPVADNKTHKGRGENRRVEVRTLVIKGLAQTASAVATSSGNR